MVLFLDIWRLILIIKNVIVIFRFEYGYFVYEI